MPHVTFIYPCVGRFPDTRYVRSWQMQPLSIAVLSALTPAYWQRQFFDDRLEPIDYDAPTDLVAISIETFTARRCRQIAAEYRRRGVPVVMGGYHATFCPEEVLGYADAVCVGEAEGVWDRMLRDAESHTLAGVNRAEERESFYPARPDRSIFEGKNYFKLALVETGRGCPHHCEFCSIAAFYNSSYRRRPVQEVINEIRSLKEKIIFFVDDNLTGDPRSAEELFLALKPLNIQWISQAGIDVARNSHLLDLMVESGCLALLIGFESLNRENLLAMRKHVNLAANYDEALQQLRKRGILIYGTFLLGHPHDSQELAQQTAQFARSRKMFLAAFNHLLPFPGVPLYKKCKQEDMLKEDTWWMSENYRFGQAPFRPTCGTAEEVQSWCHEARRDFYGLRSILHRSRDLACNCANWKRTKLFFTLNLLLRREINQKRSLPLGLQS